MIRAAQHVDTTAHVVTHGRAPPPVIPPKAKHTREGSAPRDPPEGQAHTGGLRPP